MNAETKIFLFLSVLIMVTYLSNDVIADSYDNTKQSHDKLFTNAIGGKNVTTISIEDNAIITGMVNVFNSKGSLTGFRYNASNGWGDYPVSAEFLDARSNTPENADPFFTIRRTTTLSGNLLNIGNNAFVLCISF